MGDAASRGRMRRARRIVRIGGVSAAGLALTVVLGGLAVVAYGGFVLLAGRPIVSGPVRLAGLSASVEVTRDRAGVPTLTAANRVDLARGLGFVHAQERFFQMDLQRRASAGELSGLVGAVALPFDRARRLHRFRAHAEAVLARQTPAARAVLVAYAEGVNAGLAALGHAPFEYSLLRARPAPWRAEDSLLVVYTMYLALQDDDGGAQALHGALVARLGARAAAFLDPDQTPQDAPVDDSTLPPPDMPDRVALPAGGCRATPPPPAPERGSNSFAVAGTSTATGAGLLASDMHLELGVPNIWFQARQRVAAGADGAALTLDGVTLPGAPIQVAGSNGRIAWGFTDAYIETGDLIRLDVLPPAAPGGPWRYATPDGPRAVERLHERLCPLRGTCTDMDIAQTIWGPVYGHDGSGAPLVWRWIAEDDDAIDLAGMLEFERAGGVRAALDAAHRAAIPQQNLLVADADGHIGWTVIGRVPRRVGLGDRLPHSWADGTHGWQGRLMPGEIPEIVDPPSGRLWTANGRVVGGAALARLGDGGYADGLRAGRIRDDLAARTGAFTPLDALAIQTDDHAAVLRPWQALLLRALDAETDRPDTAALRQAVVDWGEDAVPGSVGYRLVHAYRAAALDRVFGAWVGAACPDDAAGRMRMPARSDWSVLTVLQRRPAGMVPPGFADWRAVDAALVAELRAQVARAGGLDRFTWGAANHVGIHHPLSRAVPALGWLTDPPDLPEAGDTVVPRVQVTGFGASERLAVSPGHEAQGLFEMPVGQGGDPLAGYDRSGQEAWRLGQPGPLLPGPASATLILHP